MQICFLRLGLDYAYGQTQPDNAHIRQNNPLMRISIIRGKIQRLIATKNKPGTAKVGAISKAQILKGGPFGLCETPAGCKKFKKN